MSDQNDVVAPEQWAICAGAPDLIVDGLDRTVIILCSHAFEGTPEERRERQVANGRRVVAAFNAFAGIPTEVIEAVGITAEGELATRLLCAQTELIASLQTKLNKAWDNFRELKKRAEDAEAKVQALTPEFTHGQIVRVDHERFHGEGLVDHIYKPRGAMIGVRLGNDNVWQYEAETVKPFEGVLPENHWIKRRQLPSAHDAVLDEIAEGLGIERQEAAAPVVERTNERAAYFIDPPKEELFPDNMTLLVDKA